MVLAGQALTVDELDRALADPAFRAAHLPDVPEQKVFKFRQLLRDGWRTKLPNTARWITTGRCFFPSSPT